MTEFLTLLGGGLGGLLRLAPELFKLWDRANERKHERDMFDKHLAADKQRSDLAVTEAKARGQITLDVAGLEALKAAITGQSQITGNRRMDAFNSSVRPVLTYYWCIGLYSLALVAQFWLLNKGGNSAADAILMLWGPEEKVIVSGMINFWFLDRVIKYQQR